MGWKQIWQNRSDRFDSIDTTDRKQMFLELKRIDGFDMSADNGLTYESLIEQHNSIMKGLSRYKPVKSVFDLGCGSGANLYLLQNDGYIVGGMDYSEKMIELASKVLDTDNLCELVHSEAVNMPTDKKYDSIVANSVFSYFSDWDYAEKVLNKIVTKIDNSFALIDLHNEELKEDFLEYRRKLDPNYDERYKDLHKLFYTKAFFEKWAASHNCEVIFTNSEVKGYWNNKYVFNAFFYKKN